MSPDHDKLLTHLNSAVSSSGNRRLTLQKVAAILRTIDNYRWVGLYEVDRIIGMVAIIAWSGPSAPEYPRFPVSKGLTVFRTAFGTTRSEIIVPVFDTQRENVIGTIDVESEHPNAFSEHVQDFLEACADVIWPLWQR